MKKSKKNISKKIILSVISILLLILMSVLGLYAYIKNTIYTKTPTNDNLPKVAYEEVEGIQNILLIGTDARKLDEKARADSIIIATIDNNNKKLKLTSIMRDIVVDVPNYGQEKINASLALGGPELLLETINTNFNLELEKYVMVNFRGFESIIDSLGGIDVDIKDYEIKEINKYIGEGLSKGEKSKPLENPGIQHLDGQQSLAYARIRKVGNGDYERTERQRRVIDLVVQKLKDISIIKYPSIMSNLLPYIKTNIEPINMLNYAYTAMKFSNLSLNQLRIPSSDLISQDVRSYKKLGWVLLVDREQSGEVMRNFIYNDKVPTDEDYDIKMWKEKYHEYIYGKNKNTINENNQTNVKPNVYEKEEQKQEVNPNENKENSNKEEEANSNKSESFKEELEQSKPSESELNEINPETDSMEQSKPEENVTEEPKPEGNMEQLKPENSTDNSNKEDDLIQHNNFNN